MSRSFGVKLDNFPTDLNALESGYLNADAQSGASSIVLKSQQYFESDLFVLIGSLGGEGTEIRRIISVSGTTISVPALERPHRRFSPVTLLAADQLRVWKVTSSSRPAANLLQKYGEPFPIDYDNLETRYIDENGSDDSWYGYTFVNSITGAESSIEDSQVISSDVYANYASIESIRRKAGLSNNRWITDAMIEEKRQAAQALVHAKLTGIYTLPFTDPVNPLISEIVRLLAAGWLLTDDYGPLNKLDTSEGQQMLDKVTNKDGTGLLDRLNTKDLEIVDESGNSIAIPGSGDGFSMWPDETTASTASQNGGGDRMFETGGWQGYGGRAY